MAFLHPSSYMTAIKPVPDIPYVAVVVTIVIARLRSEYCKHLDIIDYQEKLYQSMAHQLFRMTLDLNCDSPFDLLSHDKMKVLI
jgi:hypothetical protein